MPNPIQKINNWFFKLYGNISSISILLKKLLAIPKTVRITLPITAIANSFFCASKSLKKRLNTPCFFVLSATNSLVGAHKIAYPSKSPKNSSFSTFRNPFAGSAIRK